MRNILGKFLSMSLIEKVDYIEEYSIAARNPFLPKGPLLEGLLSF